MCPTVEGRKVAAECPPGFRVADHIILWISLIAWIAFFLAGVLVNSEPFRLRVTSLEPPVFPDRLLDGLVVAAVYTLTNVAILCILAAILGTLGRRSQLGVDGKHQSGRDSINPRSSAVLRGFVVYLALISGVLIFGESPAAPTQTQYVRLAGFASLLSFVVNWNPTSFASLLEKISSAMQQKDQPGGKSG